MARIIGREKTVEALASLCKDYRGTALKSIREGNEEVYIPVETNHPIELLGALANPEWAGLENKGNEPGTEPCYTSIEKFLEGKNEDGTKHQGYVVIDVVSKLVTDYKTRGGSSLVPDMDFYRGSEEDSNSHCF